MSGSASFHLFLRPFFPVSCGGLSVNVSCSCVSVSYCVFSVVRCVLTYVRGLSGVPGSWSRLVSCVGIFCGVSTVSSPCV